MPTVFAIAAHPDDIEFLMSGTLMLLNEAGYDVHYMNVANGCCGTTEYDRETIAQIRREEGRAAAESIGAVFHDSICNDLEIFYDQPTLSKLASVMREVAPEIVLTHAPVDYMEDHTNTCRLAVTAAFCRGMPNFHVDPPAPTVHQTVTVYHAQPYFNRDPLRNLIHPDFYVDVTDLIDRKTEMLGHHASQKNWLDESQGVDSYYLTLRDLNAEIGRMSGKFEYAEGWRRHLHIGFCGPDDDPLTELLAARLVCRQPANGV
jgi:LmbE family N-acetylglucosaminyl deacetylase